MITREDAKDMIEISAEYDSFYNYCETDSNYGEIIDKVYDSFEQHIKDLEAQLSNTKQLTCDGCEYLQYDIFDLKRCNNNNYCKRDGCYSPDLFTTKNTK